jgi:glycosyltransferase involved in cell wall biosynthesis
VAISRTVLCFAADQLGTSSNLTLVMNGVTNRPDASKTTEEKRCIIPARKDSGEVVFTLAGQLFGRKGHEIAIRAFARAIDVLPHLRLVLAYPNSESTARFLQELKRLATQLGCENQVTFAGYVANINMLLRESDAVLVPSEREPFGRIAVEAMLMKLPVIASQVDALSEIVVDEVTGLLFPVGDIERLASAIVCLARNPELRFTMGANARQRALQLFSSRRMAAQMQSIYFQLGNAAHRSR